MSEKTYKVMGSAGAGNIVVGVVVIVVGIAAGVLSVINGARLLREKKGLIF